MKKSKSKKQDISTKDFAIMTHKTYEDFLRAGFSSEQSFILTQIVIKHLIDRAI